MNLIILKMIRSHLKRVPTAAAKRHHALPARPCTADGKCEVIKCGVEYVARIQRGEGARAASAQAVASGAGGAL